MSNNRRSICALIHPRRMTALFLALLMVFSAIPMAQAASLSVSCSANKSKANVGDNLTASMKASGGSGSYQYAWIVTCNGIEKDMTPYGNYTQWTYRADQEGTWKFQAYVMDKETDKTASAICTITVGDTSSGGSSSDTESSTPVSVSVTRGQSSADVGDTISAIATAKGGSGNYLYTWKVRLNGSTVHTVSNITTRNYSYYTNKAGKWTFRVTVTDVETGETDTDTTSTITVSEAEPDPLSVSVSKTKSSAKVGETIGAICSAEGGSEDYNYAWEVHCNGSMVYNTDFNYGSSFNYKPDRAGSWSFKVYVEDTETGERKSASTGSITVVADEACKHTSTKNVKDDSYDSWVRGNDENTHEVVYAYNVVCSSCGYVVKKGEIYAEDEPHTFNSKGICTACGYEEECSHSQTYESIRGQDGLGSSLSSTQHEIDYIYAVICSGCGEELREVIRTSTENHVFDANGDCTMCDYRVACKHTSTKLVKADEVYTVLNATQHKYTVIYDRYCANAACGKLVEYGIQEEEKQNHSFSGNTCTKCHYTKAEELSVSVSRGQTSTEVGNIISATASVSGGSGKYQIAWSVSCNGVQMNMTDYSMNTYYGYNAYQAGSWRFTVYVRDANTGETRNATTDVISVAEAVCLHPSSIETYLRTDYEKISDANHYEKKLYQKSCASCGEITNSGFYRTETKPHSLDSSGRCICGYVKTVCQHKNLTEKQVGSELQLSNLDSSRHIITYYYQDTCRDCGVVVNARREKTATAAHYLENGKCACGYVEVKPEDTCDHAPERTLISTDLALENKEMHRIVRVYRYTCQCGQVDYESTQESYAYHTWNAQGVCACGQAAPVTPVPVTPPPVTPVPVTPVPVTPAPITPAPVTPGPSDQPLPEGECDHIPQRVPGDVKRVNQSEKVHEVITQYHFFCACGQVDYWAEVSGVYEEHQYTSRGHVQARHDPDGHATFNRCPCGATEMTGNYTTYSECCTCNGHKWGEAYQENNEWKHQCQRKNCGVIEVTEAPEEYCPLTGEHQWITKHSDVHPHYVYYMCDCGAMLEELRGLTVEVFNCCECGGHDWYPTGFYNGYTGYLCVDCGESISYRTAEAEAVDELIDLYNTTKSGAKSYRQLAEMNGAQLTVWTTIARQATEKLTDEGFVFAAEALKVYSNPSTSIRNATTDLIVPKDKYSQQQLNIWKELIIETLTAEYDEQPKNTVYKDGKKVVDYAYDVMDLDWEELDKNWKVLGGRAEWAGIDNMASKGGLEALKHADDLTDQIAEKQAALALATNASSEKIEELSDQIDNLKAQKNAAIDNANMTSGIQNIPVILAALDVVGAFGEEYNSAKETREAYALMAKDFYQNASSLQSIIINAEATGNTLLVAAATETLAEITEEFYDQTGKVVTFMENTWDGMQKAGTEVINIATDKMLDELLDYGTGGLLSFISVGATTIDMMTNHGEVYESAQNLMTVATMNAHMDLMRDVSEDDGDAIYKLWAHLQMKGVDYAKDYLKQHKDSGFGQVKISELGLDAEDRSTVNKKLNTERSLFESYAKNRE